MDTLSPDIQKMLAEYRELLAESVEREKVLYEENMSLRKGILKTKDTPELMGENAADELNVWYSECIHMRNSLSWRITKPLRVLAKVLISFKNGGLKFTLQKIKRHLVK